MPESMKERRIEALRRRLEGLERSGRAAVGALPFGVAGIDRALPGGGLARGALHELRGAGGDAEDGAVAAAFLVGILARLDPPRPVLWCAAEADLYAPGVALCGLDPARLVLAEARSDRDILWAMEEGLRSPALGAVVGELGALPSAASRRLQLAAAASGVTAFALRRWRTGEAAARQRDLPIAAATRWQVAALPGDVAAGEPGVGRPRWRVELWRCRGGMPAEWLVEACDAAGHVSLAVELADRPLAPPSRPRRAARG
jgi:protein ImuA